MRPENRFQLRSTGVRIAAVLLLVLCTPCCSRTPRPPIEVTGVRFPKADDPQFQIKESRGLIVSVRINQLAGKANAGDFLLASAGIPGVSPFAAGFPDAADPNQRWITLFDHEATIQKEGTYELVYLLDRATTQASLHYKTRDIGSFKVPW